MLPFNCVFDSRGVSPMSIQWRSLSTMVDNDTASLNAGQADDNLHV